MFVSYESKTEDGDSIAVRNKNIGRRKWTPLEVLLESSVLKWILVFWCELVKRPLNFQRDILRVSLSGCGFHSWPLNWTVRVLYSPNEVLWRHSSADYLRHEFQEFLRENSITFMVRVRSCNAGWSTDTAWLLHNDQCVRESLPFSSLLFLSPTFQSYYCKCRGLLLHVITQNDIITIGRIPLDKWSAGNHCHLA